VGFLPRWIQCLIDVGCKMPSRKTCLLEREERQLEQAQLCLLSSPSTSLSPLPLSTPLLSNPQEPLVPNVALRLLQEMRQRQRRDNPSFVTIHFSYTCPSLLCFCVRCSSSRSICNERQSFVPPFVRQAPKGIPFSVGMTPNGCRYDG